MHLLRQNTVFEDLISSDKDAKFKTSQVTSETEKDRALFTRLICTQGPACWTVPQMVEMIKKGMRIARLNFSHGDHETHANNVKKLNEAMEISGQKIAILLDTKGPEIRTGFFKPECNGKIVLEQGKEMKLYTDYEYLGDSTGFACSYPKLTESVTPGSKILCADGSLILKVTAINGTESVTCLIENNCTIGERKNMNLPNIKVDLPVCGPKEVHDIQEFGIPQGVHFIAASFVQERQDIIDLRKALGDHSDKVQIIAKIENVEGINNFNEILEEADGIMVARGDMGMEIPPQKVFVAQKMMIAKCNYAGKPVITATQMLESMITNPRPTRAEAGDVANAVLDGTDMVMLSGESANGSFPIQAVETLADICREAEACIDPKVKFAELFKIISPSTITESVCLAACGAASQTPGVVAILCITESGRTANALCKFRSPVPIIACTNQDLTLRHLMARRAVFPYEVKEIQRNVSEITPEILKIEEVRKLLRLEESLCTPCGATKKLIVVAGTVKGSGSTNAITILNIE